MRVKYIAVIILVIITFLILGLILGRKYLPFIERQILTPKQTANPTQEATASAKPLLIEYDCEAQKSVFELLQQKHQVSFEESSFGKFVSAIDNLKQGEGKYWLYSLDDKEATTSADFYFCQDKEKVKWELK